MRFEFRCDDLSEDINSYRIRELNEDDYFKSMNDFIKYLPFCKLNLYCRMSIIKLYNKIKTEIQNAIETHKTIPMFCEEFKQYKSNILFLLRDYHNEVVKSSWNEKAQSLIDLKKQLIQRNDMFIKEHKDEVFTVLDSYVYDEHMKIKEKKRISNKKRYDEMRMMLDIKPKVKLTDEERKESKKIRNKTYVEKKKIRDNKQPRILLTKEEKIERKKLSNKKYRDNIKQPKEQQKEQQKEQLEEV